ncbi:MAG TPA: glycosyltransferase [Patescibacteria group bacterium]|nr:glycosyltransferase [Patescibacteria group bacterium]
MLVSILVASVLAELLTSSVSLFWRFRKAIASLLIIILGFSEGVIIASRLNVIGVFCALVVLYRLVNLFRIIEARMNEEYLRKAYRRTAAVLGLLQLIAIIGLILPSASRIHQLPVLALAQSVLSVGILLITQRNIHKTRHLLAIENYSDKELPTLSICIPARNETDDLEACLRSILANNYPKLEVLVLDDCPQENRTPEIIRGFAHDGVRFIKGTEPSEHWLAKNWAYQRLAEEASADLILFCGVDVRFGSTALRAFVTTMLAKRKSMISVLPQGISASPLNSLIQSMRYWWELAPPRRFFNRPPVLSTCWIIKRKTLLKLGGFSAVSHSIIPEGYFARELIKTEAYSFMRADKVLSIASDKPFADQLSTAVRMRYPQIRKRPEMALMMTLIEFIFLILPFCVLIVGIWHHIAPAVVNLEIITVLALLLTHISVIMATNPASLLFGVLTFPLSLIMENLLGNYSMLKYEFSTVVWKDRNICIPVMHVVPRLPELKP